jgi:hypothetical protein
MVRQRGESVPYNNVVRAKMTGILLVAAGLTAGVHAGAGQSPAGVASAIDRRLAASFVLELQRGLARDDRAAVAALIAYPITVFAGGVRIPIRDAAFLLENYNLILPANLRDIVTQARIADGGSAARYPIALRPGALSIADDVIEAQSIEGTFKITRITIPLSLPGEDPAATVPRSETSRPRAPRRIVFERGVRSARVSGALAPGGRESYIFSAAKDQWVEVRVERVHGRAILARIVDQKRRAGLDARARAGARIWTGRMPASGEYRVEVERVVPTGTPALPYDLVVTLR